MLVNSDQTILNGELKMTTTTTEKNDERIITNDKQFKTALGRIVKNSNLLADDIHIAGIYALKQVNIHGQVAAGIALIEAMGKKHDKARVQKWMIHFGKFGVKDGMMVYRKRKDINPENVEAWIEKATALPYWELTKQAEIEVTLDYYQLIKGIFNKAKNVPEMEKDGKKVTELNEGLLAALKDTFDKFQPVVIAKK